MWLDVLVQRLGTGLDPRREELNVACCAGCSFVKFIFNDVPSYGSSLLCWFV